MSRERIDRELAVLREGGQMADLLIVNDHQAHVLYRDLPTGGIRRGLAIFDGRNSPRFLSGYPGALIDLAGLPVGSPFLAYVKGGQNNQGELSVGDCRWQLAAIIRITEVAGHPGTKLNMDFTLTSTISSLGWTAYDKPYLSEDGRKTIDPSGRGTGVQRTSAAGISALPEL